VVIERRHDDRLGYDAWILGWVEAWADETQHR
jgi:hypothetical protein